LAVGSVADPALLDGLAVLELKVAQFGKLLPALGMTLGCQAQGKQAAQE
jgi:hypothetical protein